MPCYRGAQNQSLVKLTGENPVVTREAWLMVHNDYRDSERIQKVMDWIIDIFKNK